MESYLKEFDLTSQDHFDVLKKHGIESLEELKSKVGDTEFFHNFVKDIGEADEIKWRKVFEIEEEANKEDSDSAYEEKRKLEDAIVEKGLDGKYWIRKFKERLSISSLAALKYVDSAGFVKLKRDIRYEWEKKALMELMDIENESRFGQMRKADQEKAKKRMEDAKQLISELNDLKAKGKELGDSGIEEKMNKVRAALEIPDSAWISQEKKDLKDVIDSFENLVTDIDAISREDLSESNVLESASAGLALKGLLLSKTFEDGYYRQVLTVPNEVKFLGTAMSPKTQVNTFTSKTSKSNFTKTLDSYGYSVASSVKGGYGLVSAEVGGSYSNNNENEEEKSQSTSLVYYSQG